MTTDKPAGTIASRRRNRFGLLRPVGGEHSHSGHSPQVKTRHVHSMPRQQRLRGGPLLFIVLLAAGVPIANQIAQSSPQGAIVFMSCLSIA